MSADATQPQEPFAAGMAAKLQLGFTLTVHMDDGTTKDYHCVARPSSIQKEQDNGEHHRS